MNQRADIINRIATAATLSEQAQHVAALDAFDRDAATLHAEGRQVDWANTVVAATMSPVAVHERSTIETDWLGEITASAEDVGPKVIAEAAAWYGRVSPDVKGDHAEFTEQAMGIARRTASQYGEQAAGVEASFLEYVHFLNRRQAASGLPQVQQLVDSHENPAQQGLPQDVFDTFGPPVHPINQGVSGTESSERAPLIEEIESEGGAGSTETHHDTTQSFQGPAPVEARPGTQGTTASLAAPLFTPTVGISHTATLADFAPGGKFHKEAASCGCPGVDDGDPHMSDCPIRTGGGDSGMSSGDYLDMWDRRRRRSGDDDYDDDYYHEGSKRVAFDQNNPNQGLGRDACSGCGAQGSMSHSETQSKCSNCGNITPRQGSRVEAASGLPQVQQTVDAKDENPAPTPLPEEVAFPWDLEEAPEIDERSDHKASIEHKRREALAYLRGLALQPTASLTDVQRLQVAAFRTHADQWTQGNPQYHGPGAANTPFTTPEGTSGTHAEGYAEGQSDWRNDEAPTFADDSSAVPAFVQGHSEGYGDAARQEPTAPGGATPGQLPPGAGGFGEYQTHTGSKVAVKMTCDNCGRQDNSFNMTIRGNGHNQTATCTNCKPVAANHGLGDSNRTAPATMSGAENIGGRHRASTSALFVTEVEKADPDFNKAYKYASTWTPGKPLVRRKANKVAFEAGLYAGISDNPDNQAGWIRAHEAAASRYRDAGFTQRLGMHTSFSQKVASVMPSLRMQGSYLAQPLQATAATSSELDTSSPGVSPSPTGQTPINGPGTPPPLEGGTDAAAPGGPSPYNGAPPYGAPVVRTGPPAHGQPVAIDTQPGAPVDAASYEHLSPQTHAFRMKVQANLLAQSQQS